MISSYSNQICVISIATNLNLLPLNANLHLKSLIGLPVKRDYISKSSWFELREFISWTAVALHYRQSS